MAKSAKKINTGTKHRTVAVVATPFIVLGGICIGFGWKYLSGWNRKPELNLPRSLSFAAIHGGKLALDRLVDYQNYRGKANQMDADINELERLLENEQPNFKELQQVLGKLEMSGKEDEAIKVLKKALKKAQKKGKSQDAYEIGMLLAEMYIYKGDVQRALKCKCLAEGVSDARIPLYKAIISLMEQKEDDARRYWGEFKDMQHMMTNPPTLHADEFVDFKSAVNLLKQDIDTATQLKKQ